MASNSILNAVQHYQRSIEKSANDEKRLLYCVEKLYKMPITVEHLQQTGIGRTVNGLRKHNGELAVAAEAVVNKWKELVASESDMHADNQSSDNEPDVGGQKDEDGSDKEHMPEHNCYSSLTENNNHISNDQCLKSQNGDALEKNHHSSKHNHQKETSSKHTSSRSSSSHKSEHRNKSKDYHSKVDKSHKGEEHVHKKQHKSHKEKAEKSSSKEKDETPKQKRSRDEDKANSQSHKKRESNASSHNEKHHHSSSKNKHHDKEENAKKEKSRSKSEHKSHNHSSSKPQSSNNHKDACEPSTSSAAAINAAQSERKRHLEDVNPSDKSNSPKKHKSNSSQDSRQTKQVTPPNAVKDDDDGIDSSMGANFADVLGMLNMPQKKVKKSLSAIKQHTSPQSTKTKTTAEINSTKSNSISKLNEVHNFEQPTTSAGFSSIRSLEKKPDLLASNAKLAPLDPSIALELPIQISNNYKPLPLNPTVMDCVFNSSTSSSSRAPPRMLSDAEALSHGISSKTLRTKVYSGVKTGQLLQAPSLFDLCIRILQKNIDALEYTGGVPFDVLRPVLERATPQQLFTFEEYNPYLMEDSDVLWQQHCQRNYRAHKREEMETWREMFMRCQDDQERRLNRLAENIKQSQKAIALPVRKTQLAFVDSLVKPPRSVMRKQEQYGTKSKLVATPAARVAALSNVTPNAGRQGDARLRVAASISKDPAQVSHVAARPKKAPLMAKTLQFMRGRHKR